MIITRKIEVFISEDDKNLRKSYYASLYAHRDAAVKVANMGVSHLFALDNTLPYLTDEARETVRFIGCKGQQTTRQNATYVVASQMYKGKGISMAMIASVLNTVQKCYTEDRKTGMWSRSLRSYKSNMPVPIKASEYRGPRFADYTDGEGKLRNGCFFTVLGIPFQMRFGRDRSGNRLIVERVIDGSYKMSTSSLQIDGKKVFLLLCCDIPARQHELDAQKTMYAYLDVLCPIVCSCDVNAIRDYDSGNHRFEIGTAEEFNHHRLQIQAAVRRCQIANRYARGGKGRERKCQAIERWHDREKNYVDTKLHTYSRLLVDLCIKHKCGKLLLLNQIPREEQAKEDNQRGKPFVLRNWSYYGLKDKIAYKCKMAGIKLIIDKEADEDNENQDKS